MLVKCYLKVLDQRVNMLSVQITESTFSGISNSLLTILSRRLVLRSIREMMKLTLFDLTKIRLKGLKILPATDRIPLRVGGLELIQTLKRNESDTTPHRTLKPH